MFTEKFLNEVDQVDVSDYENLSIRELNSKCCETLESIFESITGLPTCVTVYDMFGDQYIEILSPRDKQTFTSSQQVLMLIKELSSDSLKSKVFVEKT